MIRPIIIIFLLLSIEIVICTEVYNNPVAAFHCVVPFDNVCCKTECPYCGVCVAESNQNNETTDINYQLYDQFSNDCCVEIILKNNITCNATAGIGAPCILVDRFMNDIERMINFFRTGPIYLIVIVSILMFLAAGFLLYTCCIFGKKDPPLEYKYIVNSLDDK